MDMSRQEFNDRIWPVGCVVHGGYLPTTAALPAWWLVCDGQAVSRTRWSRLFSKLSTQYGPGDGVTTFNVPNMQSRLPFAPDGGLVADRGSSADIAEHRHGVGGVLVAHQHPVTGPVPAGWNATAEIILDGDGSEPDPSYVIAGHDAACSPGPLGNTGDDDPPVEVAEVSHMPPWTALYFLVKAENLEAETE